MNIYTQVAMCIYMIIIHMHIATFALKAIVYDNSLDDVG